jgi:hypothetical protein
MNVISALIKELWGFPCCFCHVRLQLAIYEPGSMAPTETESFDALKLCFSVSKIERNKVLLFISCSVWHFIIQ